MRSQDRGQTVVVVVVVATCKPFLVELLLLTRVSRVVVFDQTTATKK